MAQITKKVLAQELRRKGYSISEIAQKLGMHKSGSISKWCCDIFLSPEQIKKLTEKQKSGSYKGRMKFLEGLRKTRIEEVARLRKEGLTEIGKLNKRDLLIGGIAMYWSEGYTYSGGEQVGFTNSDSKMILYMLKWFKEICQVPDNRFSLQVKINKIHKDRVQKVESYWSQLIGIPLNQFNKTVLIRTKSKKIYPNHDNYYGTLRITIRQGTQLRRKIHGWIEGLNRDII